jgi:hypothetical protein
MKINCHILVHVNFINYDIDEAQQNEYALGNKWHLLIIYLIFKTFQVIRIVYSICQNYVHV